jgi:hypothetical protein
VFGFVKENLSRAKRGRMAVARMGVWGKGQQSLAPRQHTVDPERD